MTRRARARAGAALAIAVVLAACGEPAGDDSDDAASAGGPTVTFRLWDEAAAGAYQESFDAFNAINREIHVEVEVVPQESYASRVASDLADGTMADIFWTTSDAVAAHAHAGDLIELHEPLGEDHAQWQPAITELYSGDDDELWAVPQVWDSTVLFYNTELVEAAGVDPASLTWDPAVVDSQDEATADTGAAAEGEEPTSPQPDPSASAATDPPPADTLRPAVRALTRDSEGRAATDEGFQADAVAEYGINTDLTSPAVWLPFLAQLGGAPTTGDGVTLDGAEGHATFTYLADLAAVPPADTGDRELFTTGRLALFQSTSADLRHIAEHTEAAWGVAPVPAGPDGSVSVVDGIGAAANAGTENPEATLEVLRWISSPDGQSALASQSVGVPAATGAQELFLSSWADRGVDVAAALTTNGAVTAASGPRAQDGLEAVRPILAQLLRGELPVADALAAAQQAADDALGS